MAFEKGKSGNTRGCPKGAHHEGRPADWLAEKCRALIDKFDLVVFLAKVASGVRIEQVVTENGDEIPVPASIKDRLKALEMLLNRGYGKGDTPDTPQTPADSVIRAEQAARLLKELEAVSAKKPIEVPR